jgi:hypothetical protein
MIAPTVISNFDEIVKKMIFNSEGKNIKQPSNVVDIHGGIRNDNLLSADMCNKKRTRFLASPYETPPP